MARALLTDAVDSLGQKEKALSLGFAGPPGSVCAPGFAYSVRGRSPRPDDALGEVMRDVNTLDSTLLEQRLDTAETRRTQRERREDFCVVFSALSPRSLRLRGESSRRTED